MQKVPYTLGFRVLQVVRRLVYRVFKIILECFRNFTSLTHSFSHLQWCPNGMDLRGSAALWRTPIGREKGAPPPARLHKPTGRP